METFANLAWEPGLETWLGKLLRTLLGNLWEPCLRTWLANLAWEPLPGNLGTLAIRIFAAPTCSGTFTMFEDPKLTLLGDNVEVLRSRQARWPGQ